MPTSLVLSLVFHAAIVLVAVVGLPHLRNDPVAPPSSVPVQVVTVAETAATPPAAEETAEANEPEAPPPASEPAEPEPPKVESPPVAEQPSEPAPPPEPPEMAAPAPPPLPADPRPEPAEPRTAAVPPPPIPEPKPEPEVPEPPKAAALAEAPTTTASTKAKPRTPPPMPRAKPDRPKVAQKPPPEPKTEPPEPEAEPAEPEAEPKQDDFAALENTVENMQKPKPVSEKPATAQPRNELETISAALSSPSPTALTSSNLTISEVDALRRQLEGCWIVPSGAKDAEDLSVEIRVRLDRDGTVRSAEIVDRSRMARDTFFRAAAESAQRAVYKCSPLSVPGDKFSEWRDMTLTFDPRDFVS